MTSHAAYPEAPIAAVRPGEVREVLGVGGGAVSAGVLAGVGAMAGCWATEYKLYKL